MIFWIAFLSHLTVALCGYGIGMPRAIPVTSVQVLAVRAHDEES
jgi:hypothetical protein